MDDEVLRNVVLTGGAGCALRQVHGNDLGEVVRQAATGEPLLGPDVAHLA
ncbi:hypothetical protein J7I84_01765 [Arthrobacter sp. ISL-85]|nr:hypothetical protein [Arthrobacter sp. ISL-85]MBT2565234.1 hypothetical protein [Arthrobacter sp. ISL-85]